MTPTIERPQRFPNPTPAKPIVFVNRDRFCELLISRKNLERSDSVDGVLRGLTDLKTGRRYVIEETKL